MNDESINIGETVMGEMKENMSNALTERTQNIKNRIKMANEKLAHAKQATAEYMKDNLWKTICLSIGAGFLAGLLCSGHQSK